MAKRKGDDIKGDSGDDGATDRTRPLGDGAPDTPIAARPDAPENLMPDGPTVVDEQRARSAEIEAAGVEPWKAAQDGRSDSEKTAASPPKQVQGVSPAILNNDEGPKAT